jgi:UDP-N-acetylglucosamine enolpyruvyl transferase
MLEIPQREPEIVDLCQCLVIWASQNFNYRHTATLVIDGVEELQVAPQSDARSH